MNSTFVSPDEAALSRAISSIWGEISVAITRPEGPTRPAQSGLANTGRNVQYSLAGFDFRQFGQAPAYVLRTVLDGMPPFLPAGGNAIPLLALRITCCVHGLIAHGAGLLLVTA